MKPIWNLNGPIPVRDSPFQRAEIDVRFVDLFADGADFSPSTLDRGRNRFYQRRLAAEVLKQTDEMISWFTDGFNRHLNLGQHAIINSSSVFMSFERLSFDSLLNKGQIQSAENIRLILPSTFHDSFNRDATSLLRVRPSLSLCCLSFNPLSIVIGGTFGPVRRLQIFIEDESVKIDLVDISRSRRQRTSPSDLHRLSLRALDST